MDDYTILFSTAAHQLEAGDQIVVEGELFIIHEIVETDDLDEVIVKGENLSDPSNNEIPLFADDEFDVWAI